ncbi:MAG: hypothetical protein V4808_05305 [Pseudomonadota bacterium]
MSAAAQTVAVIGWLLATFGPIAASVIFWRWSKQLRFAWILHLLLLPLSYAMVAAGAWLMLFATEDRTGFDNTLGGPVIQAMMLFCLTAIGYYSALLYAFVEKRMAANRT